MKIYIACSLTHVPRIHFEEYVAFLHQLANSITEDDRYTVKYALLNSDPQLAEKPAQERARLCYLWDAKMVREADVIIAECSFPSTGLGIELQIAVENETPIVIIFRGFAGNQAPPAAYANPDSTVHELQVGEGFVSLMALGLPSLFKVHRYGNTESGTKCVLETLNLLHQ